MNLYILVLRINDDLADQNLNSVALIANRRSQTRKLRNKAITWPDEEERKEIAVEIQREFQFPNCVGFMDGTLLFFAQKPAIHDAPDYSGRQILVS